MIIDRKARIKTFVINLSKRKDRKQSIISEFGGRKEFEVFIVPASRHKIGAIGLWNSICQIIQNALTGKDDFIIICEDDHVFTKEYNTKRLFDSISMAGEWKADVLLGGVSWLDSTLQVDKEIFWVNRFNGLQFTVVFRKFFERILRAEFVPGDDADLKFSTLSDAVFLLHPFISIQKEFGYSDITTGNDKKGKVSSLFSAQTEKLNQLKSVASYYKIEFNNYRPND
ncbi:glycosyl transferase [Parapedobacter defluvii]|uniref:Glycosyl transferase n=1 Tax=Parapedobacter defluvii TaxID=2045106 RepID=A0ABQ1M801_9SPHI|nr:glycosyl transferase [Parapedobacter defluvii]GGC36259.1 glycosyl transferase [Parapedobacter defluvii]